MDTINIGMAVAAGVVLFLFGIEHFSAEVQAISGRGFRRFISKGTNNRFSGFALGAVVTALIQSSSATSVIAVGLVNAGVLSFHQSLGVLFGANVGTTVTAQLVALKLTDFAPALILAGFVASLLPFSWRIFGRAIFYFGVVFFSLNMVSAAVVPLKQDPAIISMLAGLDSLWLGILAGAAFTAMVQSSSVTTGVAVVLMSQNAVTLDAAIALILGANIGTTTTALLAAARMDRSAKRTAVSHAVYNVVGVLMFLPLVGPIQGWLAEVGLVGAHALAAVHLVFNVAAAALFLAFLSPFAKLVERIVPDDGAEEAPIDGLSAADFDDVAASVAAVYRWASEVLQAQGVAYTAAVLALETRDRAIENRAERTAAIIEYALEEASLVVQDVSSGTLTPERSEAVLRFVVVIDHLRQLQDSLADLRAISRRLDKQAARLSLESILQLQSVHPTYRKMLKELGRHLAGGNGAALHEFARLQQKSRRRVQEAYRDFLVMVRELHERAELADFLSIHQRLRTKLEAFVGYVQAGSAVPVTGPAEDGEDSDGS